MIGMAFEVATFQPSLDSTKIKEGSYGSNEPISVLDTRRSPSPSTSTSTSTLSSSFNTTPPPPPVSGTTDNPLPKDDWPELQPIPATLATGLEDWESLLSQDQSLRWISGDFDDTSLSLQQLLQTNQIDQNAPVNTVSEPMHQNPCFFPFINSDQNPPVVLNNLPQPPPQLHKAPVFNQNLQNFDLGHKQDPVSHLGFQKDPVSNLGLQKVLILNQGLQKVPVLNQGYELVDKKPLMVVGTKQEPLEHNHHQYHQLICDQVFAAAELTLSGNFSHAQGILARLNHQFASAPNKPFQRAAFYFKEALQMQASLNPNRVTQPFNGLFKMGAYKMFSEVSPIIQFMNFTSNQTILEALGEAKNIHIIDFDIGFGAQWASFIQELPTRNNGGGSSSCSLKITAFASPSTHHPIELGLMHENLSQFAQEMGISFELEVVNFDSFDPRSFSLSEYETIAVNLPIWSASTHLSAIPSILHFVKQLSPRIVVSLDRGCERTDLPFPHYVLQGLQYYEVLLDSIDGANVGSDISNKMEHFLFQPQIERMVSGKLQFPEPMPHWKTLFTAGGYSQVLFSNFAETQADCVVKRMQVPGFHIEKKQASLVLCWQNRELMTASAWKC